MEGNAACVLCSDWWTYQQYDHSHTYLIIYTVIKLESKPPRAFKIPNGPNSAVQFFVMQEVFK